MKKLLILGAGGHGKVVLDLALSCDVWDHIAFLDEAKAGEFVLGFPVVGGINEISQFKKKFSHAIVAIGDNKTRLQLTHQLFHLNYNVPTLIHHSAIISKFSKIGKGSVVLPYSIVNTNSVIGDACIINSGSLIEHDCQIHDGVHISPGALIAGKCRIGERSWICLGAKVINNIRIGSDAIVGAGAVVINNVDNNTKIIGVPGRVKFDGKKYE